MKSQQDFIEGLQDLVRIAKTNGDVLTKQEVTEYFSDYQLDDAKMSLIGAYMAENQIKIKGVLPPTQMEEEEKITGEELPSAALTMYMEEIKEICTIDEAEEEKLALAMEQGDSEAGNQILEANLEAIAQIASGYQGKGVQVNDLIQEGNLGFFCAMSEYQSKIHGEFHGFAMKKVKEAIESAIEEYAISTRPARKMACKVNQLNDLATAMAEELGREAKPEELAEKMNITVEEVKDIMKISLDAISVFNPEK